MGRKVYIGHLHTNQDYAFAAIGKFAKAEHQNEDNTRDSFVLSYPFDSDSGWCSLGVGVELVAEIGGVAGALLCLLLGLSKKNDRTKAAVLVLCARARCKPCVP